MSGDPFKHQQIERRFIEHVERLIADQRLRILTTRGMKPIDKKQAIVARGDDSVELKRLMAAMGRPDRELQRQMPIGRTIDIDVWQKKWWFFSKTLGRLRVEAMSPVESLVAGDPARAMNRADVERAINQQVEDRSAPTTVVLLSTSGFTSDARELVHRASNCTLVLIEPNDAGGFAVHASADAGELKDLLNPEAEDEQRERIRNAIDSQQMDLTASGLASDRIAAKTQLSTQLVESELRSYAREHPGLAAKMLDGRVVLYRESSAVANAASAGGLNMPMIDKLRSLFARRGETEKKIAFLSERRAALGQQRDRAYEEIGSLEAKDLDLREQFKNAGAELSKRRITSQLLQLRKDMERRQQLLNVLNQQINVVSTHLHNLELVQQGQTAKLPDSEEMASDAAAAEEMLATLQESGEMADTVGSVATMSMSAEEQALYEELERGTGATGADTIKEPMKGSGIAGASETPAGQRIMPPINPVGERAKERKKSEPEAG